MCTSADAYEQTLNVTTVNEDDGTPLLVKQQLRLQMEVQNHYNVGDIVHFGESDGQQYEVTAINGADLTIRRLDDASGKGIKSAITNGAQVRRRWHFMIYLIVPPHIYICNWKKCIR